MGLEAVTGMMSSQYVEKVKAPQNNSSGGASDTVGSQTADAAVSAGLTNISIVPVVENSSGGEDGRQQEGGQPRQPSDNTIKSALSQANNHLKQERTKCAFSYDEDTKRVSIKVYDADTEEVIREIPPEESLEMLEKLLELAGLIIDEKR